MIRDYQVVSPSLDGVLTHDSLSYEGIRRPVELLRVLDSSARRGIKFSRSEKEQKVLEEYLGDLYGVFMKRLSCLVLSAESTPDESVKLQAMLQEILKVKKMLEVS